MKMCVICRNENLASEYKDLKRLFLYDCSFITTIPDSLASKLEVISFQNCSSLRSIPNNLYRLKELFCVNCPLLTTIPNYLENNLEKLYCWDCPSLTTIPKMANLKILDCNTCLSLSSISISPKLKILHCHVCHKLTDIPKIQGLEELEVSVMWLKNIPHIEGLKKLKCVGLPLLTSIPYIEGLKYLYCYNCRMLTDVPNNIKSCIYAKCKWVNNIKNIEYKDNLNRLIIIQKYFHKYKKIKRMIRWVNSSSFNKWYYSPKNPGGKRVVAKINRNIVKQF